MYEMKVMQLPHDFLVSARSASCRIVRKNEGNTTRRLEWLGVFDHEGNSCFQVLILTNVRLLLTEAQNKNVDNQLDALQVAVESVEGENKALEK